MIRAPSSPLQWVEVARWHVLEGDPLAYKANAGTADNYIARCRKVGREWVVEVAYLWSPDGALRPGEAEMRARLEGGA